MFIQGAAIVLAATADVLIATQVRNSLRARRRLARTSTMIRRMPQWELTLDRADDRSRRMVSLLCRLTT